MIRLLTLLLLLGVAADAVSAQGQITVKIKLPCIEQLGCEDDQGEDEDQQNAGGPKPPPEPLIETFIDNNTYTQIAL